MGQNQTQVTAASTTPLRRLGRDIGLKVLHWLLYDEVIFYGRELEEIAKVDDELHYIIMRDAVEESYEAEVDGYRFDIYIQTPGATNTSSYRMFMDIYPSDMPWNMQILVFYFADNKFVCESEGGKEVCKMEVNNRLLVKCKETGLYRQDLHCGIKLGDAYYTIDPILRVLEKCAFKCVIAAKLVPTAIKSKFKPWRDLMGGMALRERYLAPCLGP